MVLQGRSDISPQKALLSQRARQVTNPCPADLTMVGGFCEASVQGQTKRMI
jgi:hypothetical protein